MRDAGVLTVYDLKNVEEAGMMPEQKLVELCQLDYSNLSVGYQRIYAAAGANREITTVVRCWHPDFDSRSASGKYVILDEGDDPPEDGKRHQYRIDFGTDQIDIDAIDLTLVRQEDLYDVSAE